MGLWILVKRLQQLEYVIKTFSSEYSFPMRRLRRYRPINLDTFICVFPSVYSIHFNSICSVMVTTVLWCHSWLVSLKIATSQSCRKKTAWIEQTITFKVTAFHEKKNKKTMKCRHGQLFRALRCMCTGTKSKSNARHRSPKTALRMKGKTVNQMLYHRQWILGTVHSFYPFKLFQEK